MHTTSKSKRGNIHAIQLVILILNHITFKIRNWKAIVQFRGARLEKNYLYRVIVLRELITNIQKFFAGGASPAPQSASNFGILTKKSTNVVYKPYINRHKKIDFWTTSTQLTTNMSWQKLLIISKSIINCESNIKFLRIIYGL